MDSVTAWFCTIIAFRKHVQGMPVNKPTFSDLERFVTRPLSIGWPRANVLQDLIGISLTYGNTFLFTYMFVFVLCNLSFLVNVY